MTVYAEDPHELLRTLEAQASSQDALMQRMIDQLRDMIADREALESLVKVQNLTRATRTAFLAEAAAIVVEAEEDAEIVLLSRFRRRPQLRVVN